MSCWKKKRGLSVTLEQIRDSDKDILTPEDVHEVLGCGAYSINVQAKSDPSKLGFPVCLIGSRVRIPRIGFLNWFEYVRK